MKDATIRWNTAEEWRAFECYGSNEPSRFTECFALVEATDNEYSQCWKDWSDTASDFRKNDNRKYVKWEADSSGMGVSLGDFGGMPVMLSVRFVTIEGRKICFWYGCSMVTHSGMADKFFSLMCPEIMADQASRTSDATNFGNIIHAIRYANEADKANG